jgi:hypothetical protein
MGLLLMSVGDMGGTNVVESGDAATCIKLLGFGAHLRSKIVVQEFV